MQTKILHLVRHGKALQDSRFIRDDDRPLTEMGIVNNEAAARKLRDQYAAPDLIISSYATRALHTAHIFARRMGYPHHLVQVNENLYQEEETTIKEIIENLSDEINSVMIVGHNPDLTDLASAYTRQTIDPIPTSGVVTISFETDQWSEIDKAKQNIVIHE